MTQTLTEYDRYAEQYDSMDVSGPDWLRGLRKNGFDNFMRLGFPTARKGNEAWKYTNIAPVARASFSAPTAQESPPETALRRALPWNADWNTLVFVNGLFDPALSTVHDADSVAVASLSSLVESDGAAARQRLGSLASVEEEGFTALNTAFLREGAVVHVSDDSIVERPVHLAFVSTDEDGFVAHPRVLIDVGCNSEATVIESYTGLGDNSYFNNSVAEIALEEGARIEHYRLMDESDASYHVGVARVRQKDGSSFSSRAFYKGVGLGRHDLYVHIGEGCETDLSGLYITSGSQHMDSFINIDHASPNSNSNLYYKGILSGRSRAVFGGTVFVRKGADKTNALQSDKNLLLSPDAEVDSKPALFIWADDVKCGHGATAGNVDEETVFYMRSRGVDLETASRLLIFGFASEIIDTVAVPELREYLERSFLEAIPRYEFKF